MKGIFFSDVAHHFRAAHTQMTDVYIKRHVPKPLATKPTSRIVGHSPRDAPLITQSKNKTLTNYTVYFFVVFPCTCLVLQYGAWWARILPFSVDVSSEVDSSHRLFAAVGPPGDGLGRRVGRRGRGQQPAGQERGGSQELFALHRCQLPRLADRSQVITQ